MAGDDIRRIRGSIWLLALVWQTRNKRPRTVPIRLVWACVIELRGRNLSAECLIEIDNVELPSRMLVPNKDNRRAPQIVIRESNDSALARVLRFSIDPVLLTDSDRLVYGRWFADEPAPNKKT
jgi:hypothetical protein